MEMSMLIHDDQIFVYVIEINNYEINCKYNNNTYIRIHIDIKIKSSPLYTIRVLSKYKN